MMDGNSSRRDVQRLQAKHDGLAAIVKSDLRAQPMGVAVTAAGGAGRPLIGRFGTIGDFLDSNSRTILEVNFMGKRKLEKVYDGLEQLASRRPERLASTSSDQDDNLQVFAGMTPSEIDELNEEVLGLTRTPEEIEERVRIEHFSSLLREMPPSLWPHIPVRWDVRPTSHRFYSDAPHDVDTAALHLEDEVDLSLLNIVLSPWFKLDCRDPWEMGNPSSMAQALGRWLAGYPVSPSYVRIEGDGRLVLEGNHRLRVAYFAGYRSAPLLMPAQQSERILAMIEAVRF